MAVIVRFAALLPYFTVVSLVALTVVQDTTISVPLPLNAMRRAWGASCAAVRARRARSGSSMSLGTRGNHLARVTREDCHDELCPTHSGTQNQTGAHNAMAHHTEA